MHEIITLQLGNFSNYIATHFWNTQEAYFTYEGENESPVNHDIHWRAGVGANGTETFLPRTVIYDLKGGFGSLRQTNALYENLESSESTSNSLWNGRAVTHRQPPLTPSSYQQSLNQGLSPPQLTAANVRFWSDYSRGFFHPRSVVQIYDYELNSSILPFELWSRGGDLFQALDKENDLIDRDIRPFAEESDHVQGFQMFSTIDDAWGGFASIYAERLRDEYGKTSIWTWGASPSSEMADKKQQLRRAESTARSLTSLYDHASMIIPLTPPRSPLSHVRIDVNSPWHASAFLAMAMECSTLPSRLRAVSGLSNNSFDSLAKILNDTGTRSIAKLDMSVEDVAASASKQSSGASEDGQGGRRDVTSTPDISASEFLGASATRQIKRHGDANHLFGLVSVQRPLGLLGAEQGDGTSFGVDTRLGDGSAVRRYECHVDCPLSDTFPSIYHTSAEEHVEMQSKIDVRTGLATSTVLSSDFRSLRSLVSPSLSSAERESLDNGLAELQDVYTNGWWSDSDEDDD